jgi:DNA helicase-2/ATP-dependent DNA helicase PcrA
MSVHAAKGLEFPSVFVVGLEENLFPSMQAIKSTDRSQLEEERRLFYVAITRAERFLTLTYATGRYRFGKHQYNSSSRFLEEIQPDNLDMGGNVATAKVTGLKAARPARPMVQSSNLSIQASPIEKIVGGVKVLHERFGKGKVIAVEGKGDDKIAVILFDDNQGEKRIVLRFAKLQIIN